MRIFSIKTILLSLAVLLLVCGLALDVSAQRKRKKKAVQPLPMPTPVQTTTPQNNEPAVVSRSTDYADLEDYLPNTTATPSSAGDGRVVTDAQTAAQAPSPEIQELSRQVRELSGRIDSMDAKQKLLLDLEILSRAEQRSGSLRQQLMDSTDKEAAIKSRLAELEGEMTPQAIERRAAFIGSLRPEEVRENIRKTLQAEKDRITNQLNQLQNSRAALETSLRNADDLVEKLRVKLEKAIDEQSREIPSKKPE